MRALGGPFEVRDRTPGLETVFRRDRSRDGPTPLLEEVVLTYVQTLDIALELLERERLDAAVLPSTVNLLERIEARGLNAAASLRSEIVYLDLRGAELDRAARRGLVAAADVPSLEEAFVRELGRPATTLHPSSDGAPEGSFERDRSVQERDRTLQLATPVGDELLILLQRALHDDWERAGFEVDIVTIDALTFYGEWARSPATDVALRRGWAPALPSDGVGDRSLDVVPLFYVASVVAWRDGVHGVGAEGLGRPERWWIDDG